MTKSPTMPGIRILTHSISEEWEDLLLGAYTDPERVETDRLRYLAAIGVQDPWQERRDDGDLENAVKITAVPYHGDTPAETLHIVMLYEECLGQTAKTILAAFPSEQQAEQYGNRIEADNEKSLWPAYCAIAAVTPNRLSGLPEGWRDNSLHSDYPYFEHSGQAV